MLTRRYWKLGLVVLGIEAILLCAEVIVPLNEVRRR